jgi:purine-nucleoside phosphorylase
MSYPNWSDLDSESIVPPLGTRKTPDINPMALMVSCEPDMRMISKSLGEPEWKNFFNSTIMMPPEKDYTIAGPFIGAPYSVMLLESLIAKGAKTVLVIGWCGAVREDLEVGDILLPEKAIVDEGTSKNYKKLDENNPFTVPDIKLLKRLSAKLTKSEVSHKKITLWTTDAIYRETQRKIAWYRDLGVDAVEMECSALFAVAEYRKISLAAILVVSDSVASKNWDPGFRYKRFKDSRKSVCETALKFVEH